MSQRTAMSKLARLGLRAQSHPPRQTLTWPQHSKLHPKSHLGSQHSGFSSKIYRWATALGIWLLGTPALAQIQLPPPEDIPEEILRTEIIFEARSPIDGEPLTAAEYAELQAELQEPKGPPQLNSDIRYLIFLLQLRQTTRPVAPFL